MRKVISGRKRYSNTINQEKMIFSKKKCFGANLWVVEISETRPVGFKKFQIQEGARGSNTFQFEIS